MLYWLLFFPSLVFLAQCFSVYSIFVVKLKNQRHINCCTQKSIYLCGIAPFLALLFPCFTHDFIFFFHLLNSRSSKSKDMRRRTQEKIELHKHYIVNAKLSCYSHLNLTHACAKVILMVWFLVDDYFLSHKNEQSIETWMNELYEPTKKCIPVKIQQQQQQKQTRWIIESSENKETLNEEKSSRKKKQLNAC